MTLAPPKAWKPSSELVKSAAGPGIPTQTRLTWRMGYESVPTPSDASDRPPAARTTKNGSTCTQNPRPYPRLWYGGNPGVENNGDEHPKPAVEPDTTPPNRVGSRSTAEYSVSGRT